jgi:hypothetical protein
MVCRHVIDLVVLAATPHRPIGESGASAVAAARLAAALDQIAARFQDPELSVAAGRRPRASRRAICSSCWRPPESVSPRA